MTQAFDLGILSENMFFSFENDKEESFLTKNVMSTFSRLRKLKATCFFWMQTMAWKSTAWMIQPRPNMSVAQKLIRYIMQGKASLSISIVQSGMRGIQMRPFIGD